MCISIGDIFERTIANQFTTESRPFTVYQSDANEEICHMLRAMSFDKYNPGNVTDIFVAPCDVSLQDSVTVPAGTRGFPAVWVQTFVVVEDVIKSCD